MKTLPLVVLTAAMLGASVTPSALAAEPQPGLRLEQAGTARAYFTWHGQPLLSFGGISDFLFYAGQDAYDYKLWADWAAAHGMNHVRAYPPLSWKHIEAFITENGGSVDNALFPYEETEPGSRQFDLTKFNEAYWTRFREQCEYLEQKGIIIHLLMWNGWQLRAPDSKGGNANEIDWLGHFFNPDHNVNAFTDSLGGDLKNRYRIYESVADGNAELAAATTAWFEKLAEVTSGLGNVYFDLVHEMAEHQGDWGKAQQWIEHMAKASESRWDALNPDDPFLIGMDTGGLNDAQRDWVFTRPYFDLLIYGKAHTVPNAVNWRKKYQKPYIPQESWDDDGKKYRLIYAADRVPIRKYMWKFMMAKCQQMDLYMKPLGRTGDEKLTRHPHNYDPNGQNPFEDDAVQLRAFWDRLSDYPNLWFGGKMDGKIPPHHYLLSSPSEAVFYFSSATGEEKVSFPPRQIKVSSLALKDGEYTATAFSPEKGPLVKAIVKVSGGQLNMNLPAFVDDLAVHVQAIGN